MGIKSICDGCGEDRPTLNLINNATGIGMGLFCNQCATWWNQRNHPHTGKRPFPPITITEISRENYGHDEHAINRHNVRNFRTPDGLLYHIDRVTDTVPPSFEFYGPRTEGFQGITPKLPVSDDVKTRMGYGNIPWSEAERLFFEAVQNDQERRE